jgi:hypothetical protein
MPSSRSPKSGSETGSADRALQRFYFGIGLKGRWGMTGVTGWADTFAVAVAAPENRCNPSHRARIIGRDSHKLFAFSRLAPPLPACTARAPGLKKQSGVTTVTGVTG